MTAVATKADRKKVRMMKAMHGAYALPEPKCLPFHIVVDGVEQDTKQALAERRISVSPEVFAYKGDYHYQVDDPDAEHTCDWSGSTITIRDTVIKISRRKYEATYRAVLMETSTGNVELAAD